MRWLAWYVASGAAIGASQEHPWLAWAAWLGIALHVVAFERTSSLARRVLGAFVLQFVAIVVTTHNMVATARDQANQPSVTAFFIALLVWALYALVVALPVAAFLELGRALRTRFEGVSSARLWLPLGWLAGEAVRHHTAQLSIDWLFSQWRFQPALRSVAYLGWYPTVLACLYIAASLGDALHRRRWQVATPAAVAFGAMCLLPPIPPQDLSVLAGIGAVHMSDEKHSPHEGPPGLSLVVWPETARDFIPHLKEGTTHGDRVRIDTFLSSLKRPQLLGMLTIDGNRVQNSAVAIDAQGRVLAVRAKKQLLPLGETTLFGFSFHPPFSPGTAPPLMEAAGRRIVPLICLESISRPLIAEGKALGGEVIVVMSSDRSMVRYPSSNRQALAVAVMRAVEFQLPTVRASREGHAAFISPDGRVLGASEIGTTGVLTWDPLAGARDYNQQAKPTALSSLGL